GIRDFSANEPVRQLSEGIQLYGGGPQFVGYLLEQQAEEPLYWGSTLIASALAPVPVVGRDFRYSSGTAIYNYMIYGSTTSADQVVPFSGELLMNFHLPGVLVGFALLGACLAWVHGLFRSSSSAADTYFCQYTGIWLSFLITGSLLVLAQIAFYMCLPMYVWLAIRQVVRPRQRLVFMRVPTPVGVRG
ncbi:MAG TPA: hypothetical protein VEQ63_07445, partial [Bryobacteraceae bacterium]|nr:hypothetical protein [Bryobacteraceae bacterium]